MSVAEQQYEAPRLKPGQIVTEEQVHSALEFLRDSAHRLGKVTETEKRAEHMLKVKEAFGFQAATGSAESRKATARTSEEYAEAIEEHAVAFGEAQAVRSPGGSVSGCRSIPHAISHSTACVADVVQA